MTPLKPIKIEVDGYETSDGKAFIDKNQAYAHQRILDKLAEDADRVVCEECKGAGQVERTIGYFSSGYETRTERCLSCRGTGFLSKAKLEAAAELERLKNTEPEPIIGLS